jgi:hypothetical protein
VARGRHRERSGCEVVFVLLRILLVGHQLWGAESAVELTQLPGFLDASEASVGGLLAYLSGEGLIVIDRMAGTVRLSECGAREFCGGGPQLT